MNKFNAKRTTVGDLTFDSRKEAKRYVDLKNLERAGEIRNLQLQPKFDHWVNGKKVFTYIADFQYWRGNERIVEDVKGYKKGSAYAHYRTKKKCIEAEYTLKVTEI